MTSTQAAPVERRASSLDKLATLLETRTETLTLFSQLAGMRPYQPNKEVQTLLQEFCETLVDYTASKGGIEMLTKVAAVELGPLNVTVNCVAPGAIEIERTKIEAPDYAGTWAPITPTRRIGQVTDVAAAVTFLVSDEAEFITGQTLFVDGGMFTQFPWPYE